MPNKKKKIFIIAGEVSGDVLGARVMRQLPNIEFVGVGGEEMQSCGLKSLFPMADLSVMGITEVLGHVRTLKHRIRQTIAAILTAEPDMVLTVDSPGFAKAVVRGVKKTAKGRELVARGLRFHHIVAPQVWAWRSGRAKKYAQIFDKLYAFFDFEVPYFTKFGLDTIAVGHPVAESLLGKYETKDVGDKKIITLIPGSRMSEVKKLLPVFRQVIETINSCGYIGYSFAIPVVETTEKYIRNTVRDWAVKPELVPGSQRYDLYNKTYVAIAASGTVSAELAMLHIPAIIVYKMNRITTWIGHLLIHVKWVSLVNILLNRGVYPECLGGEATADNIINALDNLVLPANRKNMIQELKKADKLWLRPRGVASKLIANDIIKTIGK